MSYAIRAAIDSGVFNKIVVSTDDPEIKELALKEGVEVDDRPEHMSGDTVTKVQVIVEYLERTGLDAEYDYVAALLPTCPFRSSDDVKEAFNKLTDHKEMKFAVAVTEYEFPIDFALEIDENGISQMVNPEGYKVTRSQDKKKRYHPNGAFYMAETGAFMRKGTFFNEKMLTHVMPPIRSFDIDYPYQFEIAEIIAKKKLYE